MSHPLKHTKVLWRKAQKKKDPAADHMYLATVDAKGKPHVRTVLLKTIDLTHVGFVTNRKGAKYKQLLGNPFAEVCLCWSSLQIQVRLQGRVQKMPLHKVTALWEHRLPEAKVLYAMSLGQSQPVSSYEEFMKEFKKEWNKWKGKDIPHQPNYVGLEIKITSVEILHYQMTRLSCRELYTIKKGVWKKTFLSP